MVNDQDILQVLEKLQRAQEKFNVDVLIDSGRKMALMRISVKLLFAWKEQYSPSRMIEALEEFYEEFDDAMEDMNKVRPSAAVTLERERRLVKSGYDDTIETFIDVYKLIESGKFKTRPKTPPRMGFLSPPRV